MRLISALAVVGMLACQLAHAEEEISMQEKLNNAIAKVRAQCAKSESKSDKMQCYRRLHFLVNKRHTLD